MKTTKQPGYEIYKIQVFSETNVCIEASEWFDNKVQARQKFDQLNRRFSYKAGITLQVILIKAGTAAEILGN